MSTELERARLLQDAAAAVGFDWPTHAGVLEKIVEELNEISDAIEGGAPKVELEAELGDLLFVVVNLARRLGIRPEAALASACVKFERRFAHIEQRLRQSGRKPQECSLDELEALWQEAKGNEREGAVS